MPASSNYWSSHLHLDNKNLLSGIASFAKDIGKTIRLMEVCGGHTNTIIRHGIRQALPSNIELVSGPGCPVCVTAQKDIDMMIELALQGIPVATYGDMVRVPGSKKSLDQARAQGAKVEMIYSAAEVLKLKEKYPDIVFFGIGFETTAPMSAFLLENKIPVFSTHKILVPGLKALLSQGVNIDGFILPGHVSVITGLKPYESLKVPQAVTGFEPEHILRGVYALTKMIAQGDDEIVNTYPEAVKLTGNKKAMSLIEKHFKIADSIWRGIGNIPGSGYEVKDDSLNARAIYKDILSKVPEPGPCACRCGDVLRGIISPKECPLFGKVCTPHDPQGACMVSSEGSCQVHYRFGR